MAAMEQSRDMIKNRQVDLSLLSVIVEIHLTGAATNPWIRLEPDFDLELGAFNVFNVFIKFC